MDALVMCGGRGTRLAADVEKPLYEVGGVPTVDRVLDALLGVGAATGGDDRAGSPPARSGGDATGDSPSPPARSGAGGRDGAGAEAAGVDRVVAVTSPHAPATGEYLRDAREEDAVEVFRAPGDGYVADLSAAIERAGVDPPVLTAAADLPLLAPDAVADVLDAHRRIAAAEDPAAGSPSTTVVVPAALRRLLGASLDPGRVEPLDGENSTPVVPAGINVVGDGGPERVHPSHDARLAVNLNRVADARVAEVLL